MPEIRKGARPDHTDIDEDYQMRHAVLVHTKSSGINSCTRSALNNIRIRQALLARRNFIHEDHFGQEQG